MSFKITHSTKIKTREIGIENTFNKRNLKKVKKKKSFENKEQRKRGTF